LVVAGNLFFFVIFFVFNCGFNVFSENRIFNNALKELQKDDGESNVMPKELSHFSFPQSSTRDIGKEGIIS